MKKLFLALLLFSPLAYAQAPPAVLGMTFDGSNYNALTNSSSMGSGVFSGTNSPPNVLLYGLVSAGVYAPCTTAGSCFGGGGGGTGTVTSVALAGSGNLFKTAAGTAVTTSGTLNVDSQLFAQSANCVVAGPASGAAASPTCRALVNADFGAGLAPTISGANLSALPTNTTLYPTLNQNTTGSAASGPGGSFGTAAYANLGTSGATVPENATANTFSGLNTFSNSSAASAPGTTFTGTVFTGGTGTTDFPYFFFNQGATAVSTWSTGGTYIGINALLGYTGNILDFHINGGGSVFSISYLGTITANSSISAGAGNYLGLSTRSRLSSPVDAVFNMTNAAQTSFTRLDFGGTTSSFGAICVSGTALSVCGADGTTTAGSFSTPQLSGSSAAPTIANGAAAGTSPGTPTITGNNIAGVITVITGTATTNSATLFTVTFVGTLAVAPQGCQLTARNANAVGQVAMVYTGAPTTTTWTGLVAGTAVTASTTYSWSYICI